MKCSTCNKEISDKSSITQWMGLGDSCKCALIESERKRKRVALETTIDPSKSCTTCGKRKRQNSGSLTHWIFSGDVCTCETSGKLPLLVTIAEDLKQICTDTMASIDVSTLWLIRKSSGNGDNTKLFAARKAREAFASMESKALAQNKEMHARARILQRIVATSLILLFFVVWGCFQISQNVQQAPFQRCESRFRNLQELLSIAQERSRRAMVPEIIPPLPKLTSVQIRSLGAEQFRAIEDLKFAEVYVTSNSIDDVSLAKLASLPNVLAIDIGDSSGYTTTGIKSLANSTTLRAVRFESRNPPGVQTVFETGHWLNLPERFIGVYYFYR